MVFWLRTVGGPRTSGGVFVCSPKGSKWTSSRQNLGVFEVLRDFGGCGVSFGGPQCQFLTQIHGFLAQNAVGGPRTPRRIPKATPGWNKLTPFRHTLGGFEGFLGFWWWGALSPSPFWATAPHFEMKNLLFGSKTPPNLQCLEHSAAAQILLFFFLVQKPHFSAQMFTSRPHSPISAFSFTFFSANKSRSGKLQNRRFSDLTS